MLPRAEVERLVAEEDVVGSARRRQPRGRFLPRLLPCSRLARVHVRRLVPAPGELDGEQRGDPHEDRDRLGPAGQARQPEEPGRHEHLEERQGEDEVPALEEDARLGAGQHERERGDEEHRRREQHRRRPGAEEDDASEHCERGDHGRGSRPAGAEVADRVPDVVEHVDR